MEVNVGHPEKGPERGQSRDVGLVACLGNQPGKESIRWGFWVLEVFEL